MIVSVGVQLKVVWLWCVVGVFCVGGFVCGLLNNRTNNKHTPWVVYA